MCVHVAWLAFEIFRFFSQHLHAGCTAPLTVSVKNLILCIYQHCMLWYGCYVTILTGVYVCACCTVSIWNISIFCSTPSRAGCMYSTAHGQREKRGFVYLWALYVMKWMLCDHADRSMYVHSVLLAFEMFRFFAQHPHAGCIALLTVSVKNVFLRIYEHCMLWYACYETIQTGVYVCMVYA
jgi:hypothetical protein